MKKIILFAIIFILNINVLNAEDQDCTYAKKREYNTLASHISVSYDYDEATSSFTYRIDNLQDLFMLTEGSTKRYTPESGTIRLTNIKEGEQRYFSVIVKFDKECANTAIRTLTIKAPYINSFYGSNLCNGHENLNVCSSRFLDYEMTEKNFLNLIEKDRLLKEQENNKKEEEEKEEEKPKFIDIVIEQTVKYYVPTSLVVVTSAIAIAAFNVIIRKIKHKI